jgi:hypothetical protein
MMRGGSRKEPPQRSKTMIEYYGLLYDGGLLAVHTSRAEGNEYEPVIHELWEGSGPIWMTADEDIALRVATEQSRPPYASYDYPLNRYAGRCEVVRLTIEVERLTV